MSITAQEIINEVSTIVGDTSSKFQDKLLTGLKQVLRKIPVFLYNDRVFETYTTQLLEGEEEISLPETIINVKEVFYFLDNKKVFLTRKRFKEINYSPTAGYPSQFAVLRKKIVFDCPAITDIALTLFVAKDSISIIGYDTEFDFTEDLRALLHDGLLYEAYMYRERPDMANAALNSFRLTLQKIEEMYMEDNIGCWIEDEDYL